jgi:hypothetical protein
LVRRHLLEALELAAHLRFQYGREGGGRGRCEQAGAAVKAGFSSS